MAIIVEHVSTKHFYVVVGTSYSYFKDSRPGFLGGSLFPHEEEGLFNLVAVADEDGCIEWIQSEELRVVEVDGIKTRDLLTAYKGRNGISAMEVAGEGCEICPGCGGKVKKDEEICPHCGLTLILED